MDREEIRASIESHIAEFGWHLYTILPGPSPTWSYTIGLTESYKLPEIVVAGRGALHEGDVHAAVVRTIEQLNVDAESREVFLEDRRLLRLTPVHVSWRSRLMLGDEERYGDGYDALQLALVDATMIDVPDLSVPYVVGAHDPWRWLDDDHWPYEDHQPRISEHALAVTDLDALRGGPLHEVARARDDELGTEWECWASNEDPIPPDHLRVVPFGLFLSVDPTVKTLTDLDEGEWATRSSPADDWEKWSA